MTLPWPQPASEHPLFAIADDDGTGHGMHVEGDEENNRAFSDLSACSGPQAAADRIAGLAADGDTIVVGADEAAHIFVLQAGQWTRQAVLYPADPQPYMNFGRAVALDGDTAYIGAPSANSVFVFTKDGESWTQQQKLVQYDSQGYSYFGGSIAADGGDVLVGTHRDLMSSGTEGAYVFTPYYGSLIASAKLMGSDSQAYDLFGWAVSIDGDNAIVGSLGGADQGGAAYIFRRSENGWNWQEAVKLVPDDAMSDNNFGLSVLIRNDYAYVGNGDHEFIRLSQNAGDAVYLFRNQDGAWTQQLRLDNGDNAPLVDFGQTIATANGYLMVGAQNDSQGGLDTGLAYIYPTCSADLKISPAAIEPGAAATLTWSSDLADTCRIEPEIGAVAPNGSITVTPAATTTYTINAAGPYGQTTEQVTVWVGSQPPSVHLTASPPSIVAGQSSALTWDATFASDVSIEPGIGPVASRGTLAVAPLQTTTYTISAIGPGGMAQAHAEVGVTVYAPTAGIDITPSSVMRGESATLTWATTHATSVIIEPGIGAVAAAGSLQVSPSGTITYTLTALGPGGIRTHEVVLTVVDPLPTVSIGVDPAQILPGESAQLTWITHNADTCTIEPDIGPVGPSGTLSVSPTASTTYTITASGPGGTATRSVTVTIAQTQVTFTADPASIVLGDTSTLSWHVQGADTVSIDNGIGPVTSDGTLEVGPGETTLYTLTAKGPGWTAVATALVAIADAPAVTLSACDIIIDPGDVTLLEWTSRNAEHCTMEPDIGEIALNGEQVIAPTETTLYAITASGDGGTAKAYVRIYVRNGLDYGDPTPAEQAHIEAINRARFNPVAEAARLGIDLNEGLAEGTIATDPVQPLACSARLLESARLHARDMVDNQYYSHESLDGSAPNDRLDQAGYGYLRSAENLSFMGDTVVIQELSALLSMHDNLFIDSDVAGRGHRINILDPALKEVGLGISRGAFDLYPYAALYTCDLAASAQDNRSFVTGVVYDDYNADGLYTAGEGVGDVQIVIEENGATTYTASAGGYRLPLDPGTYTVRALLPDGRQFSQSVTLADRNVKVDFALVPLPDIELSAAPNPFAPGEQVTLNWSVDRAESATITPDIGAIALSGSSVVSPEQETVYILTATGPGGTATRSVTLAVADSMPAINFAAEPAVLQRGYAATLSWSVSGADTISIDNSIGSVSADGSQTVTPQATTTYTLTAVAPGGTATGSVTVTVTEPPPAVTFSAEPQSISAGDSATLSWSVIGADTISIDNNIGSVSADGSQTVTPQATTIYTLTATGPGGTTSQSVTVSLPLPTVSFSAEPQSISAGDSATLSWSVAGADTVSIDNNIGTISAEGSRAVTPEVTTTYILTATGPGGTVTASAAVAVITPIEITVLSPVQDDQIDRSDVLVRGTFTNASGADTGIMVNGVTALVFGNHFAANHVPLEAGINTIVVMAVDSQGHKAIRILTVQADPSGQAIAVSTVPEAALALYEGELQIEAPAQILSSSMLVYGPADVACNLSGAGPYPLTISEPGLYRIAVTSTLTDGRTLSDETAVLVYDAGQLDALLQAKWSDMKTKLAAGDIEGALEYFGNATAEDYRAIFTALETQLPQLVQDMQAIEMIYAGQGFAKYRIKRNEVIQGQTFSITYNIYFSTDENGAWKIDRF